MTQLLATWLSVLMAASGTQHREIPQAELSLAGVTLGDTEAQVVEKLGVPTSRTEEADYLHLHLNYETVKVSFAFQQVGGLFSDNPKGCTPAGLCPGDSLERMRAVYGTPETSDRETACFLSTTVTVRAGFRSSQSATQLGQSLWPANRENAA